MITTVICLRDRLLQSGLQKYFSQNADFHIVEQSGSIHTAIQAILSIHPALVICEDGNRINARTVLEETVRYVPDTFFLICNVDSSPECLLALLHAGMNDALPSGWTEDTLWNTLDRFQFRLRSAQAGFLMHSEHSLRKVLDKKFFEDTVVSNTGVAILRNPLLMEQEYKIRFVPGVYQALFILIDPRPKEAGLHETFLPMLDVEQKARGFFGQYFETVVCYLQEDSLSVILNASGSLPDMRLLCRTFLSSCIQSFFWLSGANALSIGIGLGGHKPEDLPLEVQSAKFAGWMRLSEGTGRIFPYSAYETHYRTKESYLDRQTAQLLESSVRMFDQSLCLETVHSSLASAENSGVYISRALSINDVLVHAFNSCVSDPMIESGKYLLHSKNQPPTPESLPSVEAISNQLTMWIQRCFSQITELSDTPENIAILNATRYIQARYSGPIRLEEVAAHVNLSPSYFCAKFKADTGKTFITYLMELRIARAQVLLETTDMRIGEVADRVGFHDARHFSRMFRKATGMLPSRYREINSKNR